jgi:nucleotide-binding universal stress UspA family protein
MILAATPMAWHVNPILLAAHVARRLQGATGPASASEYLRLCLMREGCLLVSVVDIYSGVPVSHPQSILVYYDGSVEAKSALDRIGELALSSGRAIHVLAVIDIVSAVASSVGMLSDIACSHIVAATSDMLDKALLHLTAQGAIAHGHVSYGRPADCIARHAALVNADVIVIGYRGRRGRKRWWSSGLELDELRERADGRTILALPIT